jgi:cell wall-associated NlpC family hydrolase
MKNLEEFHNYVISEFPKEACGILQDGVFIPVENIASDPINFFEFPSKVSLGLQGIEYSVLHSHTMQEFTHDPRIPSMEDMQGRKASGVPWGIVHSEGENVSDILWFGEITTEPYIGRKYLQNIYDCFTLVRDFYSEHFKVDIGLHPRPADWEGWNPLYIEQNYQTLGFSPVTTAEFGDILLFSIGSRHINHLGIYLGGDEFYHHLYNRVSCKDSVKKWERQLLKILRYSNGTTTI